MQLRGEAGTGTPCPREVLFPAQGPRLSSQFTLGRNRNMNSKNAAELPLRPESKQQHSYVPSSRAAPLGLGLIWEIGV